MKCCKICLLSLLLVAMKLKAKEDHSLETYAAKAPVTGKRQLNTYLEKEFEKPYLARALVAVDCAHPNGTEGKDSNNMSVLQQHIAFFDRNNDGKIYPWETFQGSRAMGCGLILSLFFAFWFAILFSYTTQEGWLPSPLLSIYIKNIHKGKHGSDTETYDTEGRFDPSKFDAIFSKYALAYPNALTWHELNTMIRANANYGDLVGRISSRVEWWLTYSIAKDEDGLLRRETIRGLYDGSLFEQLERRRNARLREA